MLKKVYLCHHYGIKHEIVKNAEGGRCECGSIYKGIECDNVIYYQARNYRDIRLSKAEKEKQLKKKKSLLNFLKR